jgi:acetoin utilization protein AcuB
MNLDAIMSRKPVTVADDDKMAHAIRMLKDHGFKHLPVVNRAGKVVGVITDRDLKRASPSDATLLEVHELLYLLDQVRIAEIMTRTPVTVPAATPIADAARLMVDKHVGCLPVVENDRLVGIVTSTDLLTCLAKTGA